MKLVHSKCDYLFWSFSKLFCNLISGPSLFTAIGVWHLLNDVCVVNTPNWHCQMWILFSCLSLGWSFGRHLLVAILWCHCNSKVKWPIRNTNGSLQELSVSLSGVFALVLKVHCFGIVRHSTWRPLKKHFVSSDRLWRVQFVHLVCP